MANNDNVGVKDALEKIDGTIIQLKAWLEDIVKMRVECAKLEFNILGLYHTVCPEVLDSVRDDMHNANISENPSNKASSVQ